MNKRRMNIIKKENYVSVIIVPRQHLVNRKKVRQFF